MNIQRSEVQYIAAWELLVDRYGISVTEVPTFDLPVFVTVNEACATGALS